MSKLVKISIILGMTGMIFLGLAFIIHAGVTDNGIPLTGSVGTPLGTGLFTLVRINDKPTWIKCPTWDWSLVEKTCADAGMTLNRYMISFNCLPKCGKYEGDRPDIGAYEYFPGITSDKPWGDWNGIPLSMEDGDSKPITIPDIPTGLGIDEG